MQESTDHKELPREVQNRLLEQKQHQHHRTHNKSKTLKQQIPMNLLFVKGSLRENPYLWLTSLQPHELGRPNAKSGQQYPVGTKTLKTKHQ